MVTLTDILHPTRLKILEILGEGSQALATIARGLDLSKPEISRHLTRMRELNLVEKKDKVHQLTNLGEVILNLTSPIEFVIHNYDYFMNHKIDLPTSLIRDIDSLMNSELMSGTGYLMSKMDEFRSNITNEVKMMIDQPFPGTSVYIEKALLIVPSYAKSENLNLEILQEYCKYFEIRTLPIVNLTLGILDRKYGFLLFPDRIIGKIDYNHAFTVGDEMGLDFLSRIWDYFWEKAKLRVKSSEQV
ncbi:MAG: ArsR family transcriptional regulator [Candidatus Heimdallarchaeota archaeon]|nr:MAG: ArsR family transcriptional regulator [Candidatus Heimdallarchaeota archaeon]